MIDWKTGMRIAEFKAKIHAHFIGNVFPLGNAKQSQGAFIFLENTRDAAIQAMAMQIECCLGSDVHHDAYQVFVIEPDDKRDVLAQRGYMAWQVV